MPICQKCNSKFPATCHIDGKKRSLCSRLYCLDCSPFKSHNTRKLENTKNLQCVSCGSATIRGRKLCVPCLTTARRYRIKKAAVEYLGGKCHECDWVGTLAGFDFHHKDPSQKSFGIGASFNRSLKAIKQELDKCILLCSCCHRGKHSGITQEMMQYIESGDIDFSKV